ncbi:hypothetical protein SUGI_1067230 [Cryptomeria japonica]|nr:hypothetical protein SUGI_1067230 [Cryptomeria japonica]
MVSEGGEFGRGSGSSRLQTGEQIVGAPIHGKGQGKIRSWSDEADESFPIKEIQNLMIDKKPALKSTTWKDQTPGRPWKVDAPNPLMRGKTEPHASIVLRPGGPLPRPETNDLIWIELEKINPSEDINHQLIQPSTNWGNFEKWCRLQWGENINFNVLLNDYYLIEFMKNEEMFNAKNKDPYTLDGIRVHIIDWKPNFNPRFHTLPENTVWLRLYNCPLDYWHIEIIKDICKEVGTFVSMDDILEDRVWGSFIRICINTGQISEIPEEVKIIGAGEVWIQRIDKEDQLHLCPKCFSKEHIGIECEVSASILKICACVQTKSIDMKLVKENREKREANDVEQSSAASMKEVEKNNLVVYSPLVVSSHQQAHSANSESAQALLNL